MCKTVLTDTHTKTIRSGKILRTLGVYVGQSNFSLLVCAVSWSPCGNMLSSASFDGTVCVWDKRKGGGCALGWMVCVYWSVQWCVVCVCVGVDVVYWCVGISGVAVLYVITWVYGTGALYFV